MEISDFFGVKISVFLRFSETASGNPLPIFFILLSIPVGKAWWEDDVFPLITQREILSF